MVEPLSFCFKVFTAELLSVRIFRYFTVFAYGLTFLSCQDLTKLFCCKMDIQILLCKQCTPKSESTLFAF